MFHTFKNKEERRAFGGSCFLEFQYCRCKPGTPVEMLVSIQSISHWENDSLYIHGDDQNEFYGQYSSVFFGGIHSNLQRGALDMWGINYFSREQKAEINETIMKSRPAEYHTLAEWLEKAKKEYNGFYILGI